MPDDQYPPTPERVGPAARAGVDLHLWRLAGVHPAVGALRDHLARLPDDDPELRVVVRHAALLVDVLLGGRELPLRELDLAAEYLPSPRVDAAIVAGRPDEAARTLAAWAAAATDELERGGEATPAWVPAF